MLSGIFRLLDYCTLFARCRLKFFPLGVVSLLVGSIICIHLLSVVSNVKFSKVSSIIVKVRKKDLLDRMNLNCSDILSLTPNKNVTMTHRMWKDKSDKWFKLLLKSRNRCSLIKNLFNFEKEPLSREEADFPLAYAIVAYKNFMQLLFMLSAFYAPQNEYCIAISGSAEESFKILANELPNCFKNVYVLSRPPIFWGSFEIINSTYACLDHLVHRNTSWEYFQYLTGTDAPLKTNYEMVQILKSMRGAWNFEIAKFNPGRLHREVRNKSSPLPLYKSSVSALIPRAAAERIVSAPETHRLLEYLEHSSIPDESFWATLGANRKLFPIAGSSIDGQEWIDYKVAFAHELQEANETVVECSRETHQPMHYYVSRYQIWYSGCKGKFSSGSCVFGYEDLPELLRASHLVAHKFYIDFEPAGYYCVLKEIRRRALERIPFDETPYETLPQVELAQGVAYQNLTFPDCVF